MGNRTHEEQLRRIQSIADAALAHLELDELLEELLLRIREALSADTAAFLLLDEEANELVARAASGLEEEVEAGARVPLGRGFAGRVAAERRTIALDDLASADIVNPILRKKGLGALLGAPLIVRGEVIGIVHVGKFAPQEFTDEDAELLRLAADRAALAIDHGHAYAEARATAERLRRLQSVTDAALNHLSTSNLLDELVVRVRDTLSADTCAVLLLDEERGEVVARAATGLEEEVEAGVRIPLGRGFAGRVAAEGRVVAIEDIDQADIVNPILREKGIKSMLGAPLLTQGRVLGVIHVGSLTHRRFGTEDAELLQAAAERAALGLERAAVHERLIELDRLRNRFVAVAAHELRTPTTAILGSALTLQARSEELNSENRIALQELLVTQAQRLATLLEQLLDLSRLETHGVHLRRERLSVRQLVQQTLAELTPEHRDGIEVAVDPALEVDADPVALERIISNIVVNALRHGRPPVVVSAAVAPENGTLSVVVEDAGDGVPADVRVRLFDEFTRSAEAAARPGSGLGLAIARSYAQAHGGDLELLENGVRGTRFRLVIPA